MISASAVELRAGARLLLADASFRVTEGDRVGLVGRNGAGKTTLTKALAGEVPPAGGSVVHSGDVGYLPQDPRTGDLDVTARDRVLSARGLDTVVRKMEKAQVELGERPDDAKLLDRYGRLEQQFLAAGGYAANAEAERVCAGLNLPVRTLEQPLRTLSGGQRRRVELARILFSGAETLLLDEPTNHLDADSITWLRTALQRHSGGLLVISHDTGLLEAVVNRVLHLDATRSTLDTYNVGWKAYLQARSEDERRRRKERALAEREAGRLRTQAESMRAKATKAKAAQQMLRRADAVMERAGDMRQADKVAKLRFPEPVPCGKVPLTASGLAKAYGSLEVFSGVDLAIDRGARVVVLGLNGAGKTTLLRVLAGVEGADAGSIDPGHGARVGYYAQEHETLDTDRTVLENLSSAAPHLDDPSRRTLLGAFLFHGDAVHQPAGTLSGGEKTRLALAVLVTSGANVLLLDEPTNNLDPASREEVLSALSTYAGAVVLVTHDEGAVEALAPDRVLVLPDGTEDLWSEDYADLVALA